MLQDEQFPEKRRSAASSSFLGRMMRSIDGCQLKIVLDGKAEADKFKAVDTYDQVSERLHMYSWKEPVKGRVVLTPSGTSFAHRGVTVELIGVVTIFRDVEEKSVFLQQERHFEPDTVMQPTPFEFTFSAPKEHESYRGIYAKVAYYVKATVKQRFKDAGIREEVWVHRVDDALSEAQPDASAHMNYFRETCFGPESIAMDVGVDNVLHIEFRYDKKVFHMTERVLGKVTFKVADMEIAFGEVGLVRKEALHPGKAEESIEQETLQKFEVMDGTPIVGEVVPIRLYLKSIPRLTPTFQNVEDFFSVRYFLNLVLVSQEGRRYFKQQEIQLYRRTGQERPLTSSPSGVLQAETK
ncbi:vacuolar protein sorting-associated protein-like protein [Leptomonas pyrrhocoris]|uniref:Vacuolar protein sorting-associated protein-like protein n=1 Tax=Leptomonas pyrrhocoris TaxID=157538 RepID=A0A0M9G388_LEPPY|nr:vacuolar protein sorting-associated protein-like protein [Leptomonas pyrrhocoris]KPA81343.1 vacuolar protein sorting-associated protein-like protein [Leptomonas pyrrhocoris]|eukprot:XP_015659782.1 vacuolar protein sorting-associated protein-like protein [Leptomonas pyrrhocoris]